MLAMLKPSLKASHAYNEIIWFDVLQNIRTSHNLHDIVTF